jgi:hypothetical protein
MKKTRRIDLTGQQFGNLVVVGYGHTRNGLAYWQCQCSCGKLVLVLSKTLRQGQKTSCGCLNPYKRKDITNQQFGKLTVLEYVGASREGARWKTVCICGRLVFTTGRALRSGHSRSCGKAGCRSNATHRMTDSDEYHIWANMLQRCQNPNDPSFGRQYGKIGVCERWNSFENFYADMGNRPSKDHSIDREDNSKGYSPDNCRWATRKQQQRNRTCTVWVELNGQRIPLAELIEKSPFPGHLIRQRVKNGWPIEKALSTPSRQSNY